MDKITKKYALLAARNPQTGEALTRPIIAERQTRSMANIIEFAVQNNYMTGQVENLTGTVKGFFEALKQLTQRAKRLYARKCEKRSVSAPQPNAPTPRCRGECPVGP